MVVDMEHSSLCEPYIVKSFKSQNPQEIFDELHNVLEKQGKVKLNDVCSECERKEPVVGQCHECKAYKCGNCYGNCIGGSRFYGGYVCLKCYFQAGDRGGVISFNEDLGHSVEHSHSRDDFIIQCLERVLFNLPISSDGKYLAHHWDAHTGKWNEEIRFEPMDLPEDDCIVLDIGGNTDAADSRRLLDDYPQCIFHVFEPVPPFFEKLKKTYRNPHFNGKIILHNIGLGKENIEVSLPVSELRGQATFLGKDNKGKKLERSYPIIIRDMETVLKDIYEKDDDKQMVSLLHMNCEGCEWETLLSMGEHDLFKRFSIIQFGTHNYGPDGVGVRSWELCQVREYLSRTHDVVSEVPFGWERWTMKKNTI